VVIVTPTARVRIGEEGEAVVAGVYEPADGVETVDVIVTEVVQRIHEALREHLDRTGSTGGKNVTAADYIARLFGAVRLYESPFSARGDGDGVVVGAGGGQNQILNFQCFSF